MQAAGSVLGVVHSPVAAVHVMHCSALMHETAAHVLTHTPEPLQAPSLAALTAWQPTPATLLAAVEQVPPEQEAAFVHAVAGAQLTPAQGLAGTGVGTGVNAGAGVNVTGAGTGGAGGGAGGGPPATTTLTSRPGKAAATAALIAAVARVQSPSVASTCRTSASTAAASAPPPTSKVSVKVMSEPPLLFCARRRRSAPPLAVTLVTAQLVLPPVRPRRTSSSAQKAACCGAPKPSGPTRGAVKLKVTSGAGGAGGAGGDERGGGGEQGGGTAPVGETRTKRHVAAGAAALRSASAAQPRAGSSHSGLEQPSPVVSRKYAPGWSGAGIAAQRS